MTTVQVLANLIDFGLNVQDAIGAPRFRWLDEAIDPLPADRLRIESRVPEATRRALAARGYGLEVMGAFSMRVGGVQAILRDQVDRLAHGRRRSPSERLRHGVVSAVVTRLGASRGRSA